MKVVHFGAGNIGLGLIGDVLSDSNAEIIFVDTNKDIISQLNNDGYYDIEYIMEGNPRKRVSNVSAVNSIDDSDKVIDLILNADLITTSVGVNNLSKISDVIFKALTHRIEQDRPIEILANENAINASDILKEYIYSKVEVKDLIKITKADLDKYVAFINTAIDRQSMHKIENGRFVPVVEPFYEWVINDNGKVFTSQEFNSKELNSRQISGATHVENIDKFIDRKLYIVNAAHAAIAYQGYNKGYVTIQESLKDDEIIYFTKRYMKENAGCLMYKYNFSEKELDSYIGKTLDRFSNPMMYDEVVRVGRDPIRKLSSNDRIVNPYLSLKKYGLNNDFGKKVIALGYAYQNPNDESSMEIKNSIENIGIEKSLMKISEIEKEDAEIISELYRNIKNYYKISL